MQVNGRAEIGRQGRVGWDPREPGMLVVGIVLVLIGGVLPWWGFAADTSALHISSEGTDFGLWWAEEWKLYIFPRSAYRGGTMVASWDFVRLHPEYAGYGPWAIVASSFWTVALLAGVVALRFRIRARSRMRGRPTILEAVASGSLFAVVVLAGVGFPAAADSTFAGAEGPLRWGPGLGWLLASLSVGLLTSAAILGWSSDRSIRGLCWKCYRPATTSSCPHCSARL